MEEMTGHALITDNKIEDDNSCMAVVVDRQMYGCLSYMKETSGEEISKQLQCL